MTSEARRHYVIAIYGVGNPPPGQIEQSLRENLSAVFRDLPPEVHEFDWNAFAEHTPRRPGSLSRYAQWFASSFASAAWFQTSPPTVGRIVHDRIDALAHGTWALTQAAAVLMVVVSAALFLVGGVGGVLESWASSLINAGLLPVGVSDRAWSLGHDLLTRAPLGLMYGALATVGFISASGVLALAEATASRSTRPLAVTARRHLFVLLLAPCALLSLVAFRREDRKPTFGMMESPEYWMLMAVGFASVAVISLLFGGGAISFGYALVIPGILAATVVGTILSRAARKLAGSAWLTWAKILLDIGLYVGSSSYRDSIQEHLTDVVASIPDREATTIWLVGHSLGSVIALDSLTNSNAWQPGDRVRLVTLGSPVRRFFIRFFPGAFFEPQIDTAARHVATRVREFVWINAFRRFDYVGKALGFRNSGLDVQTHQNWPAHADYWTDGAVARMVVSGLQRADVIAPLAVVDARRKLQPESEGVPEGLTSVFRLTACAGAGMLGLAALAFAWQMLAPGLHGVVARQPLRLEMPASVSARVRHERGFAFDGPGRIHHFTFEFRDDTGGLHKESARVTGFFRMWSDPRFDYLALARHVRADCQSDRAPRSYEFGWSVPCWREGIPLTFDRADPSRFTVTGFEYSPGLAARGFRMLMMPVIAFYAALFVVGWGVMVPALWLGLCGLFVGDEGLLDPVASLILKVGGWVTTATEATEER